MIIVLASRMLGHHLDTQPLKIHLSGHLILFKCNSHGIAYIYRYYAVFQLVYTCMFMVVI